ncbi:MAG: HNH endonuclease [Steroidobacteraceae bacterium]
MSQRRSFIEAVALPVRLLLPGAQLVPIQGGWGFTTFGAIMSKSLSKIRISAFDRQNGRCWYCALPMWTRNPLAFATQYAITTDQAKQFQCTAEHLVAHQDGGKNADTNIVAACRFCNGHRHRKKNAPSPEIHRLRVRQRMANKRWHCLAIHESKLHF